MFSAESYFALRSVSDSNLCVIASAVFLPSTTIITYNFFLKNKKIFPYFVTILLECSSNKFCSKNQLNYPCYYYTSGDNTFVFEINLLI